MAHDEAVVPLAVVARYEKIGAPRRAAGATSSVSSVARCACRPVPPTNPRTVRSPFIGLSDEDDLETSL